ncbi:MAG TPA: serine/threonine-protein kinase [Tahibacter sp.]|uniref:serine/threonine-protein kinase n=1 Tax=Tahibacter sp. TaxID=2056211 RepID=UPI002BFF5156|nr:serine/threonine-protein kinase [Tahibacter sp.]HSX62344.1 serine/threonine-protein kinase [Tahibacter sp.]
MDAQRWRQARDLFETVVDLGPDHWEAQLLRHAPEDAALRAEVLALLHADAAATRATGMHEQVPDLVAGLAQELTGRNAAAAAAVRSGDRLGAFRLVREIGRGGMGAVWLAERADGQFSQTVAIKLIRGGWDVAETHSRFLAERQILASLQHPNIAHLVDGGVAADGRPWLALEYVSGTDLRQWCDAHALDLRRRLALFLTVCEAVEHAHQRLVVHRDLKPSNILVSDDGVVKLLDFGIAKLIDPQSASVSATRIFTPEYAAPEQVRGELVTTAVDIHALGLLLYELLSGQRPYATGNSTPAAYERAILDQEPTRPSLRLTRDTPQAEAIAAKRHLTPERLRRELRGDLDAIVLKALRKQPAQRYASVGEFVADVQRYLRHQPVLARRGNWRYHATRFLQRHTASVALGTVAALALAAGLGVAVWQARVARAERDTAREALGFMTTLFDNADPARRKGEALSVRDLLDAGVENMRTALPRRDVARGRLLLTMASAYLGLGQREPAVPLVDEALAIARAAGDRVLEASALIQQCRHLDLGNESERCPALLDRAESLLDPRDPAQAKLVAYALALRVYGLQLDNRYEDIATAMRRGLALLDDSPDHRFLRVELAGHLAFALDKLGRAADAEAVLRPYLDRLRGDATAERVLLADTLGTLATAVAHQQRVDEAIALQREALGVMEKLYGADDPAITPQLNSLAVQLNAAGRVEEALPLLERTVALDRRRGPDATHELASSLCNYGGLLLIAGRDADARAPLDESIEVAARSDIAMELGRCLLWRATLDVIGGDAAAARRDAARAREVLAPTYGPDTDLMLRIRSADLAAHWRLRAPVAESCGEAAAVAAAFAASRRADGPDARFAAFLAALCSEGRAVAVDAAARARDALVAGLSRGAQDPRARMAAALVAGWSARR